MLSNAQKVPLTCRTHEKLLPLLIWCRERGIVFDAITELPEAIELFVKTHEMSLLLSISMI
jgi:hypothetical protein